MEKVFADIKEELKSLTGDRIESFKTRILKNEIDTIEILFLKRIAIKTENHYLKTMIKEWEGIERDFLHLNESKKHLVNQALSICRLSVYIALEGNKKKLDRLAHEIVENILYYESQYYILVKLKPDDIC